MQNLVFSGILLSAPFAYLTLATPSLELLKLSAVGFGLFAGLVMTTAFSAAYDVTEEQNYGISAGVLNGLPGIVSGSGIFLVGLWKESIGITTMMFWVSLASVIAAVFLLITTAIHFHADRARLSLASS